MQALVFAALLEMHAIGGAVCTFLSGFIGYCQTVDAKEIANACDDQVRPAPIDNSSKDEVTAKVPELKACGNRSERGARDREVGMVDQERTADHRSQHDRPIGKRLAGKMGQDDLCCHTSKD